MTYKQAYVKIWLIQLPMIVILVVWGVLVYLTASAKFEYYYPNNFTLARNLAALFVNNVPLSFWIWENLPTPDYNLALPAIMLTFVYIFVNPLGMSALFSFVYAWFLKGQRYNLYMAMKEARAQERVARFGRMPNLNQSIIQAGGNVSDVNVEQLINRAPEIKEESHFSKSATGQITVFVVGQALALLLGQLIGNLFGS
jgi:hypothetical protein